MTVGGSRGGCAAALATHMALSVLAQRSLEDDKAVPYYVATQSYATLFSVTEGPVISMPAGLSAQGLPIGLQRVGRRYEDWRLPGVAKAMEPLLDKLRPQRRVADQATAGTSASR